MLTSLILFFWQFTHFYALSTKTWSGYSQAHYHMLPLNSTRSAAHWAFWSWVLAKGSNFSRKLLTISIIKNYRTLALVCAIHFYIYQCMEGTKIAGLNAWPVLLCLLPPLGLSFKWLLTSSKGVIDTKLLFRNGFNSHLQDLT